MSRPNGYPGGPRQQSDGSSRPSVPSAPSQTSTMSRAQRFENEKLRLQESCFSKVDEHGQQAESYITHLRIEEDGAYPSNPPPLESPPDNKKARVIVVAVRSTGRVRMHKARENQNGSFSIGKTWNLEDLSAVESFNYVDPLAGQERKINAQRAGALGFVVTLVKPYYWRAGTAKERDFFIASLVKIFRKYTKGRTPDLVGFSDAEKEQMFGPFPSQAPSQAPLSQRSPLPDTRGTPPMPQPAFAQQQRPSSREARDPRDRAVSTERFTSSGTTSASPAPPPGAHRYVSQEQTSMLRPGSSGQDAQQRMPSRDHLQRPPEQGLGIRHHRSREQMRRPSGEQLRAPPQQSQPLGPRAGRISPQGARDDPRARAESPAASTMSTSSKSTAASKGPSQSPVMQRNHEPKQPEEPRGNGAALFHSTRDRWQPVSPQPAEKGRAFGEQSQPAFADGAGEPENTSVGRNLIPEPQPIPERRRPPMASRDHSQNQSYDSSELKPPPLLTSRSASGQRPGTPKSARPDMPGAFYETPTGSTSNLPSAEAVQPRASSPQKQAEELVKPSPDLSVGGSPSIGATSDAQTPDMEKDEEDAMNHRPGLGPMIKKKAAADKFRKAAAAASAFKPRAGGAGERLKKQPETATEADGIHGVVPAPLRTGSVDQGSGLATPTATTPAAEVVDPLTKVAPRVEVQGPNTPAADNGVNGVQLTDKAMSPGIGYQQGSAGTDGREETKPTAIAEQRKPKRRSAQHEQRLASLGVEPSLLEGKGLDFEATLADFGWGSSVLSTKNIDNLEIDLKKEIGRVEAGSWLGHLEQKDDRVEMVDKMLDRAIAECEELDGLLTLYSVELSTLNDDIAFIEAQSQGLQVQTANQKILHTELQNLVDMISLTPDQLEPIERGSFDDELEEIESSLVTLYQAMLTIDPALKSASSVENAKDNSEKVELATMNALQEKREIYLGESSLFCQRLISRLIKVFDAYLNEAIPSLLKSPVGKSSTWSLHPAACNAARTYLWQYSPVILFTKEVDQAAWRHLLEIYMGDARPLYATIFRTALDSHKKSIRTTPGDEDILFTSAEKETTEGLASTTRKLTMKRSQTIAKSVRSASGEKAKMLQSGRQMPCEAFADMLGEWAPVLAMEQNFVVELFHATSLETMDFAEAVASYPPEQRTGPPDLMLPKLMEPDRPLAEYVQRAMQFIFEFWPAELKKLVEQAVANDQMQAVGLLAAIAVYSAPLHETSQEFLLRTLTDASSRIQNLFSKFIDDQIRAIEDTKVKIKKRKGVIAFMRIFPHFSMSIENIFGNTTRSAAPSLAVHQVRQTIDDAYERINQAMWVSLKQIARESPTAGAQQGANADSEDKEVLNYHILLIENMNHYIEEVDEGASQDSVLARWKGKALLERAEHLDEYVKRVVRRPLGKLLDFIESTETLLNNGTAPANISTKASHSRSAAKKTLSAYDGREIRKGIDALRKRIEKHFGDADDEALAQKLVGFVCAEAEREYARVLEREQRVVAEVYAVDGGGAGAGVEIEWSVEDVRAGFRR